MNEERRNLQHAMTSFAYWGGLLVDPDPRPRRTPPGLLQRLLRLGHR
jgi:hypothetical protein